ncbi:long-chain-fatty-acid--CoA ligase [Kocuria sp. p3-SID1433]|uniref:long-chain-fatty-acid--CoA ligase n=1 Tax=unclassified Kocuria TaxID=2649579 RepID=UPI0021A52BEA|nr:MULTISPECIES: long-chain-fatty-acid--CoA ligase [unclassified Kocuria]MCT1601995.1 long-chain-fatty-acid--CoA ligase [Kocuria sp. p3-SID1428]MCT2179443.1 long-chain-fatty-acid--CoA ligase [Kocuria sp. p3-SID1433]
MAAEPQLVHGAPSTMGDHEQLTTTRMLRDAARSFGDQQISYQDDSGKWQSTDYAATWDRVQRVGSALEGMGIGPDSRVGVLLWNSLEHYESYFSIPLVGATMVQLNMRLAPADLAYVIGHSGVTTLIVDHTLLRLAQGLREHIPQVTQWIVVGPESSLEQFAGLPGVCSYEQLIAESQPLAQIPNMAETTASAACYTTGTTGRPKGVFLSHRSVWLHAMAVSSTSGLTGADKVMMLTPMFHVQCWGLPFAATAVGAQMVLPGRFTLDDMDMLTAAILEQEVTLAPAAPAILMPMLRSLKRMDTPPRLDGLRFLCGASEPPVSMMRAFHELTGAEVVHAYGATETSPVVTMNRMKPSVAARVSEEEAWEMRKYQGLVVAGVDVKIVDPTGEEVPNDGSTAGEVRLRGPWIVASYADNPEATEAGFDEEGYWRSGDVGYLNEHGYLKITDRLKDVIKSGGEWISSIDMENRLMALDGVVEATVIGVPHPKWEERPLALVVRSEGSDVTEASVREHLCGAFAEWQLPDEIRFIDEIARTSVGKINKKKLRDEYSDAFQPES